MAWDNLPLLIILILSVLGSNQSVSIAVAVLLIIKLLGFNSWFPVLETKGLTIGITILTISILTPLATGRVTLKDLVGSMYSPIGIVALITGLFVAWTAGRGIDFINTSPEMVSFLVLGTILGVCFLHGIAVGPLIAGGLVSLLVTALNIFKS
ncbi:MAG: rane protein yeaL [Firmicutes bacterium]|nr:rane protein yeaL [Bacillota bacterium]